MAARRPIGVLRKLHHRGREKVNWIFAFTSAANNSVRLRTLLTSLMGASLIPAMVGASWES